MSIRVINWFKSYLTRSQMTKYGDVYSSVQQIPAGIAQGTVLGPLIFIFYINDCEYVLENVKISMFADDCVLHCMGNNWERVHEVLQNDLTNFVNWSDSNRLRLNESKTQSMIVCTRNKFSKLQSPKPFCIKGKDIKFVNKYNFLGVVLDTEMNLQPLCKVIEKRVIDKIFMLKKLRKCLTYKAAIQIYKQTILPILDYSGILLISCNKSKKHDFQVMQNDILRFCENKKLEDRISIDNLHKNANLLSLEQRRVKQNLILMYKLSKYAENRAPVNRITRRQMKFVFRTDTRIGTKYATSPYYKGTLLWDKLSKEVQDSESVFLFKKSIEKQYPTFDKDFVV